MSTTSQRCPKLDSWCKWRLTAADAAEVLAKHKEHVTVTEPLVSDVRNLLTLPDSCRTRDASAVIAAVDADWSYDAHPSYSDLYEPAPEYSGTSLGLEAILENLEPPQVVPIIDEWSKYEKPFGSVVYSGLAPAPHVQAFDEDAIIAAGDGCPSASPRRAVPTRTQPVPLGVTVPRQIDTSSFVLHSADVYEDHHYEGNRHLPNVFEHLLPPNIHQAALIPKASRNVAQADPSHVPLVLAFDEQPTLAAEGTVAPAITTRSFVITPLLQFDRSYLGFEPSDDERYPRNDPAFGLDPQVGSSEANETVCDIRPHSPTPFDYAELDFYDKQPEDIDAAGHLNDNFTAPVSAPTTPTNPQSIDLYAFEPNAALSGSESSTRPTRGVRRLPRRQAGVDCKLRNADVEKYLVEIENQQHEANTARADMCKWYPREVYCIEVATGTRGINCACGLCDESFPSVGHLKYHLKEVHEIHRALKDQTQRKRNVSPNDLTRTRSPSQGPSRMADTADSGQTPSTRAKKVRPSRASLAASELSETPQTAAHNRHRYPPY